MIANIRVYEIKFNEKGLRKKEKQKLDNQKLHRSALQSAEKELQKITDETINLIDSITKDKLSTI